MVFGTVEVQGRRLPVEFKFKTLISDISSMPAKKLDLKDYYQDMQANVQAMDAAETLYRLATGERLQTKSEFGNVLQLNSQYPFDSTCISYVAPEYRNSGEYALTFSNVRGYPTSHWISDNGQNFVFGPATMSIFEGMGYSTLRAPRFPEFEIDESFTTDAYNPMAAFRVD